MEKTRIVSLICGVLVVNFVLLQHSQTEIPKIKIVTTVFPLLEFAQAVSGERGEVSFLLPPGAEVHTWKPRPSDIINLSSADCFIYIGANLEAWIHDLLKSVKRSDLRIIEVSRDLLDHENGEIDPHIWLDFELDQIIVDKISACLSEMAPDYASFFERNGQHYKQRLQRLHQRYQVGLENCEHRTLLLGGHSAFGYLARKYNLHQISLYGLSPNSKPTPRTLVEVVKLAKSQGVDFIFFETYVSDDLAKVMAKEVGARTIVLNPGANLTKEQLDSGMSFFDIMEENLENLRHGLGCQ